MLFAAWSEGAVLETPEKFKDYVLTMALKYSNPIEFNYIELERKE
jgi:hypothetical protein